MNGLARPTDLRCTSQPSRTGHHRSFQPRDLTVGKPLPNYVFIVIDIANVERHVTAVGCDRGESDSVTTVLSPRIIDAEVAAFDGKTLLRELLICPGSAEEKAVRYLLRAAECRLPIATTEHGVTLHTGWSVFALLDVEVV